MVEQDARWGMLTTYDSSNGRHLNRYPVGGGDMYLAADDIAADIGPGAKAAHILQDGAAMHVGFEAKQSFFRLSSEDLLNDVARQYGPIHHTKPLGWKGPKPDVHLPIRDLARKVLVPVPKQRPRFHVHTRGLNTSSVDVKRPLGGPLDLRPLAIAERDEFAKQKQYLHGSIDAVPYLLPEVKKVPRYPVSPTAKTKHTQFKAVTRVRTFGDGTTADSLETIHTADMVHETVAGHTTTHALTGLPPMLQREELIRRTGSARPSKECVVVDPKIIMD
eukprot:CAMPEP_0118956016 /NCGR_PEP_ID=MMETSP1169-20130426/60905_1 /TAXON_ID=36882 /ORGANISM="Pyramimonas obovata, Strain CCMP722" /LENGTH=275 /DNA_ID=CAMNT_0006903961 /DNA_START=148 /DNA_END=972 /DNA_ORIENTATION=+